MGDEVPLNIGVSLLVHEHARGRVQHRDDADPVPDLGACDDGAHFVGDRDSRELRRGADREALVMNGHARQDTSPVRTWGEERAAAARRLRAGADPATAALDADVLLAFAVGATKEQLLAHPDTPLAAAVAARMDALVARRAAGEPVAYLRGWKE